MENSLAFKVAVLILEERASLDAGWEGIGEDDLHVAAGLAFTLAETAKPFQAEALDVRAENYDALYVALESAIAAKVASNRANGIA